MEDNYSLWRRKEAEAEAWLAKRPECSFCGEPIQDDECYPIPDYDLIFCPHCMEIHIKRDTEDFCS